MKVEIGVISGLSYDSYPVVTITINDKKYLFNSPSFTQRCLMNANVKLSNVNALFVTSNSYRAIAGLCGYVSECLMTSQTIPIYCAKSCASAVILTSKYSDIHCDVPYKDQFVNIEPIELTKSVSYVMTIPDEQPKFDAKIAKSYGVKAGLDFKKLKEGNSVTLENGQVITAEMCIGNVEKGGKILITEVLDLKDLEILKNIEDYVCIVHFSSPEMLKQEQYQAKFANAQTNIAFNMDGRICYYTGYDFFEKHHKKDPKLVDKLAVGKPAENIGIFKSYFNGDVFVAFPESKRGFSRAYKLRDFEEYEPPKLQFNKLAITMLGTNAGFTHLHRVASSIIVHTNDGNIILDCGEGFLEQLRRKYGLEQANQMIADTLAVYTTHFHWDHCGGIQSLLAERRKFTNRRIPVFCDDFFIEYLKCDEQTDGDYNVDFILRNENTFNYNKFVLRTIPTEHCENSMGCCLDYDGLRVAYPGDHHILDKFGETVGHCDILIHEATKGDREDSHEEAWGHSSVWSAEKIGNNLGAKLNVITHISKRFQEKEITAPSPNMVFAFDFMTVRLEDKDELRAAFDRTIPFK
ncbi:metallo-beta-lactamase superfamily protein [Trichomonas vaginalis G3]|uniref:ribonuclease Z n=1 Tax=Trichomonas vaginalis (strain ATCC PRA-98 / G3) TaxID=412133 RepID=A2DA23_TRIV3|nr:3'-tRNA processing endoribonuclease protein [Trichomonas vaginalis G3]EAY22671.1 metallo-beta-lactamase superfamily protein [Trichomonas vaginalis G3]KAI5525485.1 3'-tRNA processing endoribonuclease protein [Trichomonas vaginalis G3]|eukprot:XP_001583657.1 metallo-beta-lactamase superfamily protein [Trichomonas vaginalis G3]